MQIKANFTKVIPLLVLVAGWGVTSPTRVSSQQIAALSSVSVVSTSGQQLDPTAPASELNHHLVGYALIAIAGLVIAGQSTRRLRPLQLVWPMVFIAMGLFLAVWSDGEIWPRGNLNWLWLVHHDAEARQHKIYAILLVAMGIIEYLRARGKLSPFWRTWAFSLLAVFGVVFLLFHDHSGSSGASSPEALNYRVSWSINGAEKAAPPVVSLSDESPVHQHEMMPESAIPKTAGGQQSAMEHEGMDMGMGSSVHGHQHVMTPAMTSIEHQHMWFALIGLAVVVFKFIADSAVWRRSFVPFLWPSWIAVLGMLLVFYAE
jgi:hypothetical protein